MDPGTFSGTWRLVFPPQEPGTTLLFTFFFKPPKKVPTWGVVAFSRLSGAELGHYRIVTGQVFTML